MHIEKLVLTAFKNYARATLTFSKAINFICGPNGSGKTNILEAIHYLSMTKGAHNTIDSQNIKTGMSFFSVKGILNKEGEVGEVICSFQQAAGKSFKVNKKEYPKLSLHIGKYPVVLTTPNDTDIIRDGSEIRRKLIDTIFCQLDRQYLQDLQYYNHNLRQRNALLKKFNRTQRTDLPLLDKYDRWLVQYGSAIYKARKHFLADFREDFLEMYAFISDGSEAVNIDYRSDFQEGDLYENLKSQVAKEVALERTTLGIHRDDLKFTLKSQPLKKFGSQGQQKSFSIALRLAQFRCLHKGLKIKPILLLDDIFDKLDESRTGKIIELMTKNTFGQVVITDAMENRVRQLTQGLESDCRYIRVKEGEIR